MLDYPPKKQCLDSIHTVVSIFTYDPTEAHGSVCI